MMIKLSKMISGGIGNAIDKVGYTSIGSGFGIWAYSAYDKTTDAIFYLLPSWPQTWPDWAAAFSALGAISFIVKNIVESYVKLKKRNNKNDNE